MNNRFDRVLRPHPEPQLYLNDRQIHEMLTTDAEAYLSHMQRVLERIAAGTAQVDQPAKQIFTDPDGGGDFRVMPCVFRDGVQTVKTVKLVGTNLVGLMVPDQITVGRAFSLHPKENFVTHTFDACLLSSARTGACAAIAVSLLATLRESVTVVGSGRVGYYAALYIGQLPGVKRIRFNDLNLGLAAEAAMVQEGLGPSVDCRPDDGLALGDSNIAIVATDSCEALIGPSDVRADLVVSVGADTETQRELAPEWAQVADVYTDTLDSWRVGDLRAWHAAAAIKHDRVTSLVSLLQRGPRKSSRSRRVFISTGSALFDNITIAFLQSRLSTAAAPAAPAWHARPAVFAGSSLRRTP